MEQRVCPKNGHHQRSRSRPKSADTGRVKVPGSAIQMVPKRSANGPKAIAWPLSSGRQELTSRSSYLYAIAPLDRPVRERDLEVSEFGLRDAQCVARSPIMVGDPFLRGWVPMMGVVEVFPEWPPWFAFTLLSLCIQCAELDDERPSHHHPFASVISGVPFDCREHRMPPSK